MGHSPRTGYPANTRYLRTRDRAGVASTAPTGGERFERGAGAPATPSEKQLLDLAAKAQTPSEHGSLREYYTTLAVKYEADAKKYARQ